MWNNKQTILGAISNLVVKQEVKILEINEDCVYVQYGAKTVRGICTDPDCHCVGSWGDE